jgi:hypothetical protein
MVTRKACSCPIHHFLLGVLGLCYGVLLLMSHKHPLLQHGNWQDARALGQTCLLCMPIVTARWLNSFQVAPATGDTCPFSLCGTAAFGVKFSSASVCHSRSGHFNVLVFFHHVVHYPCCPSSPCDCPTGPSSSPTAAVGTGNSALLTYEG